MPAARPCPLDKRLIDKAWLQEILRAQPGLLTLAEIEPAFGAAVCIRREVPTKVGWIDNLYIRPAGYLTLVETKLWPNREARREVVGQILGYEATEGELTSFDQGDAYAEESQGDSADLWKAGCYQRQGAPRTWTILVGVASWVVRIQME